MKKYILVILAVLIMATILMADSKGKVTTDKDLKTGLYTVKVDGKALLKTNDVDKMKEFVSWGHWHGVYKFDHYVYENGHIIKTICILNDTVNDCAEKAAQMH